MRRVFDDYKRIAPLRIGCQTMVAWWLLAVCAALGWQLLGPLGPILALVLWIAWVRDRAVLIGNRDLRREVAAKLTGLGHLVETGHDEFVGLAYPCFFEHSRRLVETDDDVGFLSIDPQGLVFVGDGDEFAIPAADITDVYVTRDSASAGLSARIYVEIASGEPQETVVFDSRGHDSHLACNRANHTIAQRIRAIMAPHQHTIRLRAALGDREAEERVSVGGLES
ncbi:MAG TPA: hypothetical protein DCZ72_03030 [Armatimonadetes bacterium]|nr:hypothetical protein [Armatimonadota bacterium]